MASTVVNKATSSLQVFNALKNQCAFVKKAIRGGRTFSYLFSSDGILSLTVEAARPIFTRLFSRVNKTENIVKNINKFNVLLHDQRLNNNPKASNLITKTASSYANKIAKQKAYSGPDLDSLQKEILARKLDISSTIFEQCDGFYTFAKSNYLNTVIKTFPEPIFTIKNNGQYDEPYIKVSSPEGNSEIPWRRFDLSSKGKIHLALSPALSKAEGKIPLPLDEKGIMSGHIFAKGRLTRGHAINWGDVYARKTGNTYTKHIIPSFDILDPADKSRPRYMFYVCTTTNKKPTPKKRTGRIAAGDHSYINLEDRVKGDRYSLGQYRPGKNLEGMMVNSHAACTTKMGTILSPDISDNGNYEHEITRTGFMINEVQFKNLLRYYEKIQGTASASYNIMKSNCGDILQTPSEEVGILVEGETSLWYTFAPEQLTGFNGETSIDVCLKRARQQSLVARVFSVFMSLLAWFRLGANRVTPKAQLLDRAIKLESFQSGDGKTSPLFDSLKAAWTKGSAGLTNMIPFTISLWQNDIEKIRQKNLEPLLKQKKEASDELAMLRGDEKRENKGDKPLTLLQQKIEQLEKNIIEVQYGIPDKYQLPNPQNFKSYDLK